MFNPSRKNSIEWSRPLIKVIIKQIYVKRQSQPTAGQIRSRYIRDVARAGHDRATLFSLNNAHQSSGPMNDVRYQVREISYSVKASTTRSFELNRGAKMIISSR